MHRSCKQRLIAIVLLGPHGVLPALFKLLKVARSTFFKRTFSIPLYSWIDTSSSVHVPSSDSVQMISAPVLSTEGHSNYLVHNYNVGWTIAFPTTLLAFRSTVGLPGVNASSGCSSGGASTIVVGMSILRPSGRGSVCGSTMVAFLPFGASGWAACHAATHLAMYAAPRF